LRQIAALAAVLLVVLFLFWLGWSGHWTEPLLVSMGALSCLAVVGIALRMRLIDSEGVPLSLTLRLWLYLPWLFWEIFKANLDVARRILHPRLPIGPRIVRVKPGQRTDLGRVIHANSITLTPGTLALRVGQDEIVVHALSEAAAEDLRRPGGIDAHVSRLEGRR
jgi:multicomponent Na+:H+ antiporter subunit E